MGAHGRPRVEDPARLAGVAALGLAETAFTAATATQTTSFVTGIADPDPRPRGGAARLLDVIDDRSGPRWAAGSTNATPAGGPSSRSRRWTPCRGRGGAAPCAALPHATRALDAFHVVRLGLAAVDDVRRRIQQELTGHRGSGDDPLFGIRRLLRRGHDHHTRAVLGAAARPSRPRRCLQRTHRGDQATDQEDRARRPRIPQLRQLPDSVR